MKVWTKPDREIWNMRSSVSCLGGGSKLRQDKNGQDAAATSSHSGTFHSVPFCEHNDLGAYCLKVSALEYLLSLN
jgi:hypothetical protein